MSTDPPGRPSPPDVEPAASEALPRARGGTLLWHHAWTIVFAANLVVPTMFARGMVGETGRIGMGLAVGLLWLVGDLAGVRSPRRRPVLLAGGVAVALTQFFPVPQFVAGLLGLGAGRLVGLIPDDNDIILGDDLAGPAAFVVTFVTGALLMLAVWLGGLVLEAIARVFR